MKQEREKCVHCGSMKTIIHSNTKNGKRWQCNDCNKTFVPSTTTHKSERQEEIKWKETNDSGVLSGMARTPEELAERYGIDMTVWEFDKVEIKENQWDVTMANRHQDLDFEDHVDDDGNHRQIMTGFAKRNGAITRTNKQRYMKVSFKRRPEVFDHKKFAAELREQMANFTPRIPGLGATSRPEGKYMYEISLFDLHLDKLGWNLETESGNYDSKIARKRFLDCVGAHLDNVKRTGVDVNYILFPIGNDFFNADVDYPNSATTRKTPQQSDVRWQRSFNMGWKLIVEAIEMCKKIAPVKVIVVPGNHDFQKSYYLGEVIYAWYNSDPDVIVDDSPNPRCYEVFGKNMIGFTHGNSKDINLPRLKMLMQQERPVQWGQTYFREWHLGDIHHSKTIPLISEDFQGLHIRYLKSLSGQDAWHHNGGYHGIKGGESFLWHEEHGMVDNFHYNVKL